MQMCNLMICGSDLVQNSFAPSQLKSQEDHLSCFSLALPISPLMLEILGQKVLWWRKQ